MVQYPWVQTQKAEMGDLGCEIVGVFAAATAAREGDVPSSSSRAQMMVSGFVTSQPSAHLVSVNAAFRRRVQE